MSTVQQWQRQRTTSSKTEPTKLSGVTPVNTEPLLYAERSCWLPYPLPWGGQSIAILRMGLLGFTRFTKIYFDGQNTTMSVKWRLFGRGSQLAEERQKHNAKQRRAQNDLFLGVSHALTVLEKLLWKYSFTSYQLLHTGSWATAKLHSREI